MISVSATARRSVISSSTRRIRTTLSNKHQLQHQLCDAGKQLQRPHSSLVASRNSGISNPSGAKDCLRRVKNAASNSNNNKNNNSRSLSSSAPPSSKPPTSASSSSKSGGNENKKTGTTEIVPNVVLATALGGFVVGVFLYSMNAVGRGDGSAVDGNDPLAQLKAEAQEAREYKDQYQGGAGGRMTDDEIWALESGLGAHDGEADGDRVITEVAVAAPADIAALEEEANLKIFRKQQNGGEEPKAKKKAWWRFGF